MSARFGSGAAWADEGPSTPASRATGAGDAAQAAAAATPAARHELHGEAAQAVAGPGAPRSGLGKGLGRDASVGRRRSSGGASGSSGSQTHDPSVIRAGHAAAATAARAGPQRVLVADVLLSSGAYRAWSRCARCQGGSPEPVRVQYPPGTKGAAAPSPSADAAAAEAYLRATHAAVRAARHGHAEAAARTLSAATRAGNRVSAARVAGDDSHSLEARSFRVLTPGPGSVGVLSIACDSTGLHVAQSVAEALAGADDSTLTEGGGRTRETILGARAQYVRERVAGTASQECCVTPRLRAVVKWIATVGCVLAALLVCVAAVDNMLSQDNLSQMSVVQSLGMVPIILWMAACSWIVSSGAMPDPVELVGALRLDPRDARSFARYIIFFSLLGWSVNTAAVIFALIPFDFSAWEIDGLAAFQRVFLSETALGPNRERAYSIGPLFGVPSFMALTMCSTTYVSMGLSLYAVALRSQTLRREVSETHPAALQLRTITDRFKAQVVRPATIVSERMRPLLVWNTFSMAVVFVTNALATVRWNVTGAGYALIFAVWCAQGALLLFVPASMAARIHLEVQQLGRTVIGVENPFAGELGARDAEAGPFDEPGRPGQLTDGVADGPRKRRGGSVSGAGDEASDDDDGRGFRDPVLLFERWVKGLSDRDLRARHKLFQDQLLEVCQVVAMAAPDTGVFLAKGFMITFDKLQSYVGVVITVWLTLMQLQTTE